MTVPDLPKRIRAFLFSTGPLGAFNVFNAESTRGVVAAVTRCKARAYVQTSASTVAAYGARPLAEMIAALMGEAREQFALHLDHCLDPDILSACIDAGWDSVMIDASGFPLEENISRTREVVCLAHAAGVAVEGEIGSVGEAEDGFETSPAGEADPVRAEDVERFVRETGVDLVAVGVGTKHGFYEPGTCRVNVSLLEEVHRRCPDKPLVLHGGSGIPLDQVEAAVRAGVRKINISTEIKEAYALACETFASGPNRHRPINGIAGMVEAVGQAVGDKVEAYQGMSPSIA